MSVDPQKFVKAMSERWVHVLENALTDKLPYAWAAMAEAFNSHIAGENAKPITVLPLPTGTGKTQGLCLYCSMLRDEGVLIVTALTKEATNIANCINDIAGKDIAVAEHGDSRNTSQKIIDAKVLVITHSAYQKTMSAETSDESYRSKWGKYSTWQQGKRKLTVIDEAIDIVDHYSVSLEQLRLLSSLLPQNNLDDESQQAATVVNTVFEYLSDLGSGKTQKAEYELMGFPELVDDCGKLKQLHAVIAAHIATHFKDREKEVDLSKSLNAFVRGVLNNLEMIVSSWSIYSQVGAYHKLTTARLVLPLEVNDVVVLDATAEANPVTRALGEYVDLIKLPKVKSYRNLTVHISIGHGVSKAATQAMGVQEWDAIFDHLSHNELKGSKAPLLCVQADTELRLGKRHIPKNWSIMHWGAINGVNDWKDCDSVIMYGLQYLPEDACAATLMAFWGWSYRRKGKSYNSNILSIDTKYIKHTYQWRHIIVSLVQAINRAHCRAMIKDGNCPVTDVYIFAKSETDRKTLQHHLTELLPDVNCEDWSAPKTESNSKGLNGTEQKIIDALAGHDSNRFHISKMLPEHKIKYRTFNNNYPKHLIKKEGKLYDAITAMGWSYLSAKEAKEVLDVGRQHFIKPDLLVN